MKPLLYINAFVATVLTAAIFGFFYAWICSTMWGLDAADPRMAIAAMQAMNTSVRNFVFAPAFFATPFALLLTGFLAWRARRNQVAVLFASAGIVYFLGGLLLTMNINVPMNLALGELDIPSDTNEAKAIWQTYSSDWQFWNISRTFASGAALLLALGGVFKMGQPALAK